MPIPLRRPHGTALALAACLAAACVSHPPKPPADFGVHVAGAGNDTARVHFTVHVTGTLQLGIRSRVMAMQRDSSLLLATPADLIVNTGTGSAVIASADSNASLTVTPLDRADSARATATGRAIRIARVDTTRHVTAAPAAAVPQTPEPNR
ncbi:MAG TPA: hypothetical protein VFT41_00355 [Gemmatimonadaceae bacterium]|nr:hypothetical protein [Gemmatimonadaceae bacterium]